MQRTPNSSLSAKGFKQEREAEVQREGISPSLGGEFIPIPLYLLGDDVVAVGWVVWLG